MAVNQLGKWMVREVLDVDDEKIVDLIFDAPENCYDTNDIEYTDIDDEVYENCLEFVEGDMVLPIVYDVISPGHFIGLRPNKGAYKDFYIV